MERLVLKSPNQCFRVIRAAIGHDDYLEASKRIIQRKHGLQLFLDKSTAVMNGDDDRDDGEFRSLLYRPATTTRQKA
jgi:hypothetical protein